MNATSNADLLYAQLRCHAARISRAQQRIADALAEHKRWAVTFSGGKDSTVVLHLVRSVAPDTPAIFIDSGAEFPETLEFVAGVPNVLVVHAEMSLLDMYRQVGDYGAKTGDTQYYWRAEAVKEVMIKEPLARAVATLGVQGTFTGLRAQESKGRARFVSTHAQPWQEKSGRWRCEPICDWTTQDVWAYIAAQGMPYNPVYDKLARLGAPREEWRVAPYAGSTSISRGRWATLKRGWPELWQRFANEFPHVRAMS